jgi:hypothetical protein
MNASLPDTPPGLASCRTRIIWRNKILKSMKMSDCRRMSELSREHAELLQAKAQISSKQRNSRRLYYKL